MMMHRANLEQADLIAMHRGYTMQPLVDIGDEDSEWVLEWVLCEFRPTRSGEHPQP
jgi:hypothetical protein